MRLPVLLASSCLVLTATLPAYAEPPFPTTDFSGTWIIQDGGGNEFKAEMRYSAAERAMRLEMAPGGMQMQAIRDMESGEVVMWSSQMPGMGMRIKTPADFAADAKPTGETRTVNGEECEVWQIKEGTACLAEGNIPVLTDAEGATAELQDLQRGPQEAGLFEPPSNLTIMNIENLGGMMKGMQLPNLPF